MIARSQSQEVVDAIRLRFFCLAVGWFRSRSQPFGDKQQCSIARELDQSQWRIKQLLVARIRSGPCLWQEARHTDFGNRKRKQLPDDSTRTSTRYVSDNVRHFVNHSHRYLCSNNTPQCFWSGNGLESNNDPSCSTSSGVCRTLPVEHSGEPARPNHTSHHHC